MFNSDNNPVEIDYFSWWRGTKDQRGGITGRAGAGTPNYAEPAWALSKLLNGHAGVF